MSFEFNVDLGGANCHIWATVTKIIQNETPHTRPHKHFSMEFHCVFSGQEIIDLPAENRQFALTAGMILLLPTDTYHRVYTKDSTVERVCFNFSAEPSNKKTVPIVDLFLSIHKPTVFSGTEIAQMVEQCRQLCMQPTDPILKIRQGMHFLDIALHLMHSIADTTPAAPATDSIELRQRWIIEDYITQHFRDNTGIEGLAKKLFLSQRQTSTLVKRFFGEDFKSLIIRRRMELAEIYLQDPANRLDDIALEVGYRSYSGFELCFKRFFGTTPTKMRNKLMKERKTYEHHEYRIQT